MKVSKCHNEKKEEEVVQLLLFMWKEDVNFPAAILIPPLPLSQLGLLLIKFHLVPFLQI